MARFLLFIGMAMNVDCSNLLIIGHRGASGLLPENTISAFEKAAALGADGIEFDLQLCKSGELVVFHDDDIKRVTGKEGLVAELTYEQLKQLDAGNGLHIPTFDELLSKTKGMFDIWNVELKGPGTGVPVAEKIRSLVKEGGWSYSDFVVTAFEWSEVVALHSVDPKIPVGLLMDTPLDWQATAKLVNAKFLVVDKNIVTEELVAKAAAEGLEVWSYTVNSLGSVKDLMHCGITGLITDFPNIVTKAALDL